MSEVFDFNSFSRPPAAAVPGRLRKNVSYFRTNYAMLTISITALVMLMNPWSLIVLAVLAAAWFYMYIIKTTPLVLGGPSWGAREVHAHGRLLPLHHLLHHQVSSTHHVSRLGACVLPPKSCFSSLRRRRNELRAPTLAPCLIVPFCFNVLQRGRHHLLRAGREHDHDCRPRRAARPDDATLFADEAPGTSSSMGGLLDMFRPKNPLVAYAAGV